MASQQQDNALYRGSAPFTVGKHVLLHIDQHRLHPCHNSMLLCRCRPHIHIPFWPVGDVLQDITFANQEDDDTDRDYLCPTSWTPVSPAFARPLTLDPLDKPQQVVLLSPLFTKKVGARLSLCYDVWRRRRCSKWICDVLEVDFHLQFRVPPMTGDSSAFVYKGSIM